MTGMTRWLATARKPRARRKIALAVAVITVLTALGIPAGASAAAGASAGTVTVSGTITDGSGHGWPLYAGVSLSDPAGNSYYAHTDPATGQYSVAVPANTAYTLTAYTPYPGYLDSYASLQAGTTDLTENAQMAVSNCTAPGYQASGGTCTKVTGGLIVGQVTDANTGQGVNGATVTDGAVTATTVATSGDPKLSGGLYWLFSSTSGPQTLSATMPNYQSATASATVTPDAVVRADMALAAGRLAITSAPVDATVPLGHTTQATVTVTNSGGAAATATVAVQHPGPLVDPSGGARHVLPAAPARSARGIRHPAGVVRIPGHYSPSATLFLQAPPRRRPATARPATSAWARLPGFLGTGIADSGLARDDSGHVYSVGGQTILASGSTRLASSWVYDPVKNAWTPIAPLPAPVDGPMAAYANGRVYAIGGWIDNNADATATVRVYDPATNTWSAGTDMPAGRAAAGVAVLNNQIYVVGGCTDYACDTASSAAVYDPAADAWQAIAPYPAAVAYLACGGIGGAVYCFGGNSGGSTGTAAGYVYQPATNKWSPVAPLPADLWGASYAAANGQLLVSGGVSGGAITNAGYAYDPGSNTWSSLPPDELGAYPTYRGSGACGFYRLGGASTFFFANEFAVLPGWDQCGTPGVPWLSAPQAQVTVPAHSSVTVTLTLGTTALSQPGDFAAQVTLNPSGLQYSVKPSPVTLHATPPAGWSQVTGTVTARPCIGAAGPADHATVEVPAGERGSVPVLTDASGHYGYWASWRDSPSLLFAKNGYLVQQQTARVRPGGTTTVNVTLSPVKSCT